MLGAVLVDPSGGQYYYKGETYPGFELIGVAGGEWYRLLTGTFLHLPPDASFGVMHLVFNMLALWNIGRVVEGQLGRTRYLALYLLSAVGGSVLVYLVSPETTAVGASGAVFGLAASFYVISRRLGRDMQAVNRFMAGLLLWLVVSAAFTSWEGHLGGLLTGGLVTYGLAYAPARLRTSAAQLAGGAVLVVLLAAVVVGTDGRADGDDLTGAAAGFGGRCSRAGRVSAESRFLETDRRMPLRVTVPEGRLRVRRFHSAAGDAGPG